MQAVSAVERLDGEAAVIDPGEDSAGRRVGGALPAALDDLRRVPGPGGIPRMRAKAAETAVSVARPASTTSAPARSACVDGLVAHHGDDVRAPEQRGRGPAARWAAARECVRARVARSGAPARCSLKILATDRSSPSSAQIACTMSATQFTPESVPLVPQEPTISGIRALFAAARSRRRSRRTASSAVLATPAPEVVGPGVGRAAVDGDDVGAETEAAGDGLGAEAAAEHAGRHQDAPDRCRAGRIGQACGRLSRRVQEMVRDSIDERRDAGRDPQPRPALGPADVASARSAASLRPRLGSGSGRRDRRHAGR